MKLLTVPQVAALLGISEQTVKAWCRSTITMDAAGVIEYDNKRAFKVGTAWLVPASAVKQIPVRPKGKPKQAL